MKQSTKGLQILGIIVGVLSLLWGIYQYTEKSRYQTLAEIATREAIQYVQDLTNATILIREHERRIGLYQAEIDSLKPIIAYHKRQADVHYRNSQKYKSISDELKKQLQNIPTVVDSDDHIKLFLDWTKQ